MNVLFIVVDDLRTALSCYGDPTAKTPNFDRLASRGVVFDRAYCQQAVCNPSRSSVMTGLRPDTIGVWDLKSHFRDEWPGAADLPQHGSGTHFRAADPDITTLPQLFKSHGYRTLSVGKIYHGSPDTQDPASWTEPAKWNVWSATDHSYVLPENKAPPGTSFKRASTEAAEVPDEAYGDGKVAREAVRILGDYAQRRGAADSDGRPLFLAVGFRKPHLPFTAPKRYWDLYPNGSVPDAENPAPPANAAAVALHDNRELRGYTDVPSTGAIPSATAARLRRGYYACVSYVDAQLGMVLDTLEATGLADDSLITLYGDHGYHLGEKSLWCKTTNFELDTRAPLVIAPPHCRNAGAHASGAVEFVDLYPTVAELCGLDSPPNVQGRSLVPILTGDPRARLRDSALSQFPRPWFYEGDPDIMGYTVRTDEYRYTEWRRFAGGECVARELYDHKRDPAEVQNRAADEDAADTVRELSALLNYRIRNPNS